MGFKNNGHSAPALHPVSRPCLQGQKVTQTPATHLPQILPCPICICSMYGIFTYIWVIFRANVGKYSILGTYGCTRYYSPIESIGCWSLPHYPSRYIKIKQAKELETGPRNHHLAHLSLKYGSSKESETPLMLNMCRLLLRIC